MNMVRKQFMHNTATCIEYSYQLYLFKTRDASFMSDKVIEDVDHNLPFHCHVEIAAGELHIPPVLQHPWPAAL